MSTVFTTLDTPVGTLVVAGAGDVLTRVTFGRPDPTWRPADLSPGGLGPGGLSPGGLSAGGLGPGGLSLGGLGLGGLAAAADQLRAYLAGERRSFDLPHGAAGTPFQERVWAALDAIPYGQTITYGALAERVGAPRDRIRAVAAAVGANPLLIVRPCHRVVGADGSLTGYAGGLRAKRHLLTLEGALQAALF
jgi:methylated-DNA-[protein]-cysteine S-methyltransferase